MWILNKIGLYHHLLSCGMHAHPTRRQRPCKILWHREPHCATVWKFSKSDAFLVSLRFLTYMKSEFENLFFISLNEYFGHKYDYSLFINQNDEFQCTLTLNFWANYLLNEEFLVKIQLFRHECAHIFFHTHLHYFSISIFLDFYTWKRIG